MEGKPADAILAYIRMQELGFSADNFTFPLLLKAASDLPSMITGAALHGQTTKTGYSNHAFVQTALINMYSSLGQADGASRVFMAMAHRDLVSWNSMLKAYVSNGRLDDAVELFAVMSVKDRVSFNTLMSGFARVGDTASAMQVFRGCPTRDAVSWNTVISAYVRAGAIDSARSLFEEMPEKNAASWNTLMAGYLQSHRYEEAVELFYEMKPRGSNPNHLTYASVLSACANMGFLTAGKKIHIQAGQAGLAWNPHVVASLIDMYAKCGSLEGALEVFYKAPHRDIFCWNAMISGLASHGHGKACMRLFDEMRAGGIKPDDITFIGLLSGCAHAGLVGEGRRIFEDMERRHGTTPKLEHYGCLVDLLSRAGDLMAAYEIVETMPFEAGAAALGALLAACAVHGSLEIGEAVATRIVERADRLTDGEYMMLANLYAACDRWEEAGRWRGRMNSEDGLKKMAGWSEIEVAGRVYRFQAGERVH